MTLTRVLAVLAAANMVAAFALATLLPPMLPLAQLVSLTDGSLLGDAHDFVLVHLPAWVWPRLALPLLLRPCWLPPTCLGIVLAGGAMTLASRKGVPRSHRRRS